MFVLKKSDDFLGGDPPVEVDIQHGLHYLAHGRTQHDSRVVVPLQDLVDVRVHAALLGDDFGEQSALHREESLLLEIVALLARD